MCSGVLNVLPLCCAFFSLQLLPRCSKEQVLGQMKDLMASLLKVRHPLTVVCLWCCGGRSALLWNVGEK